MGVCCSAELGVFKFVVEYVDYWCRYQVLCSFVVKMPRPHGNCKFRNEWLAIDKFKDWVARDRADDKVAKCTLSLCLLYHVYVCMKTVRIANAGKHAMESYV